MTTKEKRPSGLQWELPVDTYSPIDKQSFAYTTVVKRWPTIITQIISTLSNEIHRLTVSSEAQEHGQDAKARVEEGKQIIAQLSALKHDMGRDRPLELIEDDGGANVEEYNQYLRPAIEAGEPWTWFNTAWLFAECYLYRRIRNFFAGTQHWREFDPFFTSKSETYAASLDAIVHLARSLDALPPDLLKTASAESSSDGPSPLETAFMEMALANLWGNATDLSLLVDLKYEDLQALQSVGREAQKERERYVLRNDLGRAWDRVKGLKKGRVDFVLDNAGFELYTDLIFADFLVSHTDFVGEVVFHPKTIPWFVSDVLPKDFSWAIDTLQSRDFFPSISADDHAVLVALSKRWQAHLASGRFRLSIPLDTPLGRKTALADYWTGPLGYAHMPEKDPELVAELAKSDLVIFKGDLNYRKLLGDGKWDATTPFEDVLGPLKGKITCLSLRTNKADPIAGLVPGIQERLDVEDPKWRESGKWAVISYCPKDE